MVVLGMNSTHNAGNFTRLCLVKNCPALLVLLIPNTIADHAIIYTNTTNTTTTNNNNNNNNKVVLLNKKKLAIFIYRMIFILVTVVHYARNSRRLLAS